MSTKRALLALAVAFTCPPMAARANGAFPDSMSILLPADRPQQIVATTNFGLLVSDDDGATWGWVCEEAVGANTTLYELGAPPNDLLLAVSFSGVTYSADFGCTWNVSGGAISGYFMYDVSPHTVDPLGSYALARHGMERTAHESRDGARTYGPALLSSTQPELLTGIENARSRPATLYVTLYSQVPAPALVHPFVARSYNGGTTWAPRFDPGPEFDQWRHSLAGVDPVNEKRVYLRMFNASSGREVLGIYDDDPVGGGGTMRRALQNPLLDSPLTAFLRRSDGALIVASLTGAAFISMDQGATFARWPNAPHLRGLGERNGILYAVADNVVDGWAVGRSNNGGANWEPLFRFQQLTGPKNCGNLPSICAGPWQTLRDRLGIAQPDGGIGADGGGPAPRQARSG